MIANYNPADYWKHVNVPALIVEAGNDERVQVEPLVTAIQTALREAHNPDYTIVVFPNAPHTLVERSKTGEPFRWPHITPGYADLLAFLGFVPGISARAFGGRMSNVARRTD